MRVLLHSVVVALVLGGSSASAQIWGRPAEPRGGGVCFYEHIDFGGRYFCARVGEQFDRVPRGTNDEISSMQVFGNAEVTVFRADDMRGDSRRFSSSVRDLRRAGFNDRISSFVVQRRGYGNGGNWGDGGSGGWDRPGRPNRPGYGNGNQYGEISRRQAENMVRVAYRRVLRREPDAGARSWVDEVMRRNWSQRELEAALRDTPEARERR
ncbi:MAG TPA: peptidase inhibitor family I36 protein [Luteitalea sp.]|nr:peptidase inhibitor family I36 protein [Luteitalea sp.]